jgi:hypothetical protein
VHPCTPPRLGPSIDSDESHDVQIRSRRSITRHIAVAMPSPRANARAFVGCDCTLSEVAEETLLSPAPRPSGSLEGCAHRLSCRCVSNPGALAFDPSPDQNEKGPHQAGPVVLAGGLGFEPRLTESESVVLPLDDPPKTYLTRITPHILVLRPSGRSRSDHESHFAIVQNRSRRFCRS